MNDEGVLRPDKEGVRELLGVSRLAREGDRELLGVSKLVRESLRPCREEGVCGNISVFFEGVPALLEGVIGNGMTKSCAFLVGDLNGERVDDVGAARIDAADGDLGEDEASKRVRVEGLLLDGSGGRSAKGIFGTDISPACSWTHFSSLTRTSFRRVSLAAVHRATAAIPPPMPFVISISTSIPTPYTGTRMLSDFEK